MGWGAERGVLPDSHRDRSPGASGLRRNLRLMVMRFHRGTALFLTGPGRLAWLVSVGLVAPVRSLLMALMRSIQPWKGHREFPASYTGGPAGLVPKPTAGWPVPSRAGARGGSATPGGSLPYGGQRRPGGDISRLPVKHPATALILSASGSRRETLAASPPACSRPDRAKDQAAPGTRNRAGAPGEAVAARWSTAGWPGAGSVGAQRADGAHQVNPAVKGQRGRSTGRPYGAA